MSVGYTWVQWSPHKRVYDAVMAAGAVAYIAAFVGVGKVIWTGAHSISDEVLVMRALGSCGFGLLTLILCIGPLARLHRRFLPVLYNRRHLGVMTFLISLVHGVVAIGYYHGFGVLNPLVSLLSINTGFGSLRTFPYQTLGLAALTIMFLLAATSHDFWLKSLSASAWKRLHMLVYGAYALLVGHVALGALQADRGWGATAVVLAGVGLVTGLHLAAGRREVSHDSANAPSAEDGWIDAGPASTIPEGRARTVCAAGGERIAVFRHAGGVSAVTNLCAHQGGPLGEGKVIDGCITCPWHGWQYRPQDGCAPPPFVEKVATYQVRIVRDRVLVNPKANAPGTPVEPARVNDVERSGRASSGGASDGARASDGAQASGAGGEHA
ncbi:MAG: ferric reductase-like transmembrane domain-containing protein [Planctomycetota bacterium]|nr:ferric reductase-like transmembrane domain-containing protein [Planctomycetota bacterium]